MHRAGEKVIPFSNSDNKRQVTAVFTDSRTGDFLAPQIIYKGKTERSHPKVSVPSGWIFGTATTTGQTKRPWSSMLKDRSSISWYKEGSFTAQRVTPSSCNFWLLPWTNHRRVLIFSTILSLYNFQPTALIDYSNWMSLVNKSIKDDLKKSFHSWYANEVQEQLKSAPVHEVKVDVSAAVIKTKNVGWFISAWESLQGHPEIVINGFKKIGILDAVTAATETLLMRFPSFSCIYTFILSMHTYYSHGSSVILVLLVCFNLMVIITINFTHHTIVSIT